MVVLTMVGTTFSISEPTKLVKTQISKYNGIWKIMI